MTERPALDEGVAAGDGDLDCRVGVDGIDGEASDSSLSEDRAEVELLLSEPESTPPLPCENGAVADGARGGMAAGCCCWRSCCRGNLL